MATSPDSTALRSCCLRILSSGCVCWPFPAPVALVFRVPATSKFSLQGCQTFCVISRVALTTNRAAGVWRRWISVYLGIASDPKWNCSHTGWVSDTQGKGENGRGCFQPCSTTTEAESGLPASGGWRRSWVDLPLGIRWVWVWILALWPCSHNVSWVQLQNPHVKRGDSDMYYKTIMSSAHTKHPVTVGVALCFLESLLNSRLAARNTT